MFNNQQTVDFLNTAMTAEELELHRKYYNYKDPNSPMFNNQETVDFLNVEEPLNQAKLKYMVIDICKFGLLHFSSEELERCKYLDLKNLKNKSQSQIKKIPSAALKSWKKYSIYDQQLKKIWKEQCKLEDEFLPPRPIKKSIEIKAEFEENEEMKEKYEKLKKIYSEKYKELEKMDIMKICEEVDRNLRENREEFIKKCKENQIRRDAEKEEKMNKMMNDILNRPLIEPQEIIPQNDPEGVFGWKDYCNKKESIDYKFQEAQKAYCLTKMTQKFKITNNTLSSSNESGTKSKNIPFICDDNSDDSDEDVSLDNIWNNVNKYYPHLDFDGTETGEYGLRMIYHHYHIRMKKELLLFCADKLKNGLEEFYEYGIKYFIDAE